MNFHSFKHRLTFCQKISNYSSVHRISILHRFDWSSSHDYSQFITNKYDNQRHSPTFFSFKNFHSSSNAKAWIILPIKIRFIWKKKNLSARNSENIFVKITLAINQTERSSFSTGNVRNCARVRNACVRSRYAPKMVLLQFSR